MTEQFLGELVTWLLIQTKFSGLLSAYMRNLEMTVTPKWDMGMGSALSLLEIPF